MSITDLYTDYYTDMINGELYQITSVECVHRYSSSNCCACCKNVSSQTKCPLTCPVCGVEVPKHVGQSPYKCECGVILLICHDDGSSDPYKHIVTGYMSKLLDSKEDII